MKNFIDVMALQEKQVPKVEKLKHTDYKRLAGRKGVAARFLFECAIKLKMKPLTSATSAIIFHRFFKEVDTNHYDEFLIATSSLYLASKLKDDQMKIRDVINVAHNTLNRDVGPLELDDEYWAMRDAIVQAELLITRMLKFDLNTVTPHKYMLHYMKSLEEWFGQNVWNSLPIAKTAAAFLQDFHHSPEILNFKPSHIAICCLSLAIQTYGIQVPLTDDFDETAIWYSVFSKDLTRELHWEIIERIMDVYNEEVAIDEA